MSLPEFPNRLPPVRRWQFGLRTLLLALASVSLLFLVMGIVGLIWSMVLIWFFALVALHVIGNSLGTQVRGRQSGLLQEPSSIGDPQIPLPRPLAADPAAVRLRHKTAFRPLDYFMILAAGVLAGGLGASALWAMYWNRHGYSAIVVGAVSSAVLGCFLGFLCVTFLRVALGALNDAHRQSRPDHYLP